MIVRKAEVRLQMSHLTFWKIMKIYLNKSTDIFMELRKSIGITK